jgi:hypothetical protein
MSDTHSRHGHALLKLVLTVGACLVLLLVIYGVLHQLRLSFACQANLRVLYRALELYEMERGSLPRLAFYPDLATEDTESLRVVLESYGATGTACICPSSPTMLRDVGLTYVWNVRLNGRKIPRSGEREWMLVEIQALSSDVPAPHLGHYHVLYSDGAVERIAHPHPQLDGL